MRKGRTAAILVLASFTVVILLAGADIHTYVSAQISEISSSKETASEANNSSVFASGDFEIFEPSELTAIYERFSFATSIENKEKIVRQMERQYNQSKTISPNAAFTIGVMYTDLASASVIGSSSYIWSGLRWLDEAASVGHFQSAFLLAMFYFDGNLVEKDEQRAFEYLCGVHDRDMKQTAREAFGIELVC